MLVCEVDMLDMFLSRLRKRFARFCIKVEKLFDTTRINGALEVNKVLHERSDLPSVLLDMLVSD